MKIQYPSRMTHGEQWFEKRQHLKKCTIDNRQLKKKMNRLDATIYYGNKIKEFFNVSK